MENQKSDKDDKDVLPRKFTHVIFDMDGLILDTERIYTEIYDRVAEAHGGKYCWEIKVQLMGRPGKEGNRLAVELMNLPITPEQFYQEQQVHKEELFPQANVLPGADKLIRHLHKHNIPIAVASGSFHKDYLVKTTKHRELFELFPIKVFGDDPDLKRGKPFPDQFILTSSKFADSPIPENVLVFEDSSNGVLAAKAAGMGVVMVPDQRLDEKLYNNPTQVIFSLEDFKPELFGFPPYE